MKNWASAVEENCLSALSSLVAIRKEQSWAHFEAHRKLSIVSIDFVALIDANYSEQSHLVERIIANSNNCTTSLSSKTAIDVQADFCLKRAARIIFVGFELLAIFNSAQDSLKRLANTSTWCFTAVLHFQDDPQKVVVRTLFSTSSLHKENIHWLYRVLKSSLEVNWHVCKTPLIWKVLKTGRE